MKRHVRASCRGRLLLIVGWVLVALAGSGVAADSPREDVVVLENGDRISGQIKGMTQGQLVLDTDHLGTLNIPWVHIRQVSGAEKFEVELEDGRMYVGSIQPSKQTGQVSVVGDDKTDALGKAEIVRIVPLKKSFWGRLDGAVNIGYSYTKSSGVAQLSVNADTMYRTRRHMTDLALSTIFTVQQVADSTRRIDLSGIHTRFLEHNWLWEAQAGATENQELGVDARVLVGGGGGRFLKRTNRNWFKLVGGLDVNREWPTGIMQPDTNLEATISLDYSLFRYSVNNNLFRTGLTIYPGITDWGRVRAEWTLRLQQTLVGSLVWSLNGYFSLDNEPPDPTAATDDWGVVTALGWSF